MLKGLVPQMLSSPECPLSNVGGKAVNGDGHAAADDPVRGPIRVQCLF
jgi:hypothetical protein